MQFIIIIIIKYIFILAGCSENLFDRNILLLYSKMYLK